jgi:hypothetical protein
MKRKLAKYILYIYTNYIIEDFDIYKKWSLPFFKIANFFRKIYVWVFSIIFFPIFVFLMKYGKTIKEEI